MRRSRAVAGGLGHWPGVGRTFGWYKHPVRCRTLGIDQSGGSGPSRVRLPEVVVPVIKFSTSPLRARLLGAATAGLIVVNALLVPATAAAGPGTPPDPHPDTITTAEETPATGNLLANDLNPGEGTLTVVAPFPTLSASVGTLVVAANGDYTFTPAANFSGSASTSYNVANDKHTRSAAINIVVTPSQDPPVANDDTVTVTEDTADERDRRRSWPTTRTPTATP